MHYQNITIGKVDTYDVIFIPENGRKGRHYHYFEVKEILENFHYFEKEYKFWNVPRGMADIRIGSLNFDKPKIMLIYEQKQTLLDFIDKFKDKYESENYEDY